ncbi:Dam family site-specific DNA-(adenine-N6)-methyltransferase [Tranquillimonas alkanivorans]|uniref:Site-specific DNA-methyltransferase (adenine-specific) n=1 Tax=Tranquillimonas alkanivorans TaxID=441119 RepID=A0A1I5UYD5_9RHOB|nr:Dam family site-specific DNA-(adenine-N6)-methyltransferase [Tranquillimonas alkanivorans]SFQ00229.1 DNA adenine methylase [Tranquillimonas alkanivorans]
MSCNSSSANSSSRRKPFRRQLLKWIGNKQRYAHEIISMFPRRFGVYHEPFLGSGAVLAVLAPHRAEAADCFTPLIGIWRTLQSEPDTLKAWYRERWDEIFEGNKVEKYESIKARFNESPNPADLLFLCRTAYGGVIRFRKSDGYMSTRCGPHTPISPSTFSERVDEWHQRVKHVVFYERDFQDSIERAREGDVVYCDPPYSHAQAILYGAQSFCHDTLFKSIERAKRKGVFVALSLDKAKKSGNRRCDYDLPSGLFEREVSIDCGRSMLRRFQMRGKELSEDRVLDRLLLTH